MLFSVILLNDENKSVSDYFSINFIKLLSFICDRKKLLVTGDTAVNKNDKNTCHQGVDINR